MDGPDGVVDGFASHESYGPINGVTTAISTSAAVGVENSSWNVQKVVARSTAEDLWVLERRRQWLRGKAERARQ